MPTTIDTLDCKTLSPATYTNPIFHPCWGKKVLPATMSFTAGPTSLIPPNMTLCPGWPSGVITGTLTRTGPCGFAWSYSSGSFSIIFAWTAGGPPVSCTINQTEMFPNWSFNNVTGTPTGSCSQDPGTGITTMTFTGVISNGLCSCPVTVTFTG